MDRELIGSGLRSGWDHVAVMGSPRPLTALNDYLSSPPPPPSRPSVHCNCLPWCLAHSTHLVQYICMLIYTRSCVVLCTAAFSNPPMVVLAIPTCFQLPGIPAVWAKQGGSRVRPPLRPTHGHPTQRLVKRLIGLSLATSGHRSHYQSGTNQMIKRDTRRYLCRHLSVSVSFFLLCPASIAWRYARCP